MTNETNVRYLTGFTGDSSYLIVARDGNDLIVSDPRYEEQISEECPGLETFMRKPSERLMPVVCKLIDKSGFRSVLIESGSMTVEMFEQLRSESQVEGIVSGSGEVEQLRSIKDAGEIDKLTRAVDIAQRAFVSLRAQLMPSSTERQLAHEVERLIRSLGGEGCSFKPIVAAGPRAALPHAVPGNARIGDSPLLLIDWGAIVEGYRSDLTRVLLTSKIPAKIAKAYEAVLAAQTAAIASMKPGVMVSEVDAIAREVLSKAKLAKRFNHGLGHGIGLDIHEAPRLGKNGDVPLKAGMVVTVEPGVYFPGLGGIRIEDDVLITSSGAKVLSDLPRSIAENQVEFIG